MMDGIGLSRGTKKDNLPTIKDTKAMDLLPLED
jgi:hypothetical protein